MVDHIGASGFAAAGFFVTKGAYTSDMPGEQEQNNDPLFAQFKKMAKDQSWMAQYVPRPAALTILPPHLVAPSVPCGTSAREDPTRAL